jgi:uncharacterized protein YnzC (UPF0291/DUF896 family)
VSLTGDEEKIDQNFLKKEGYLTPFRKELLGILNKTGMVESFQ